MPGIPHRLIRPLLRRTLDSCLGSRVYNRLMNQTQESLQTIGRIAKQADVGVDTIRFYEHKGLLPEPQRTAKGYRLYPSATVERLNFIRRAKGLGFSLEEITALLDLQDNGGTKSTVKKLTSRKLDEINAKIADLESMRDVLQTLNGRCSGRGNVAGCPIIEALTDADQ